MLSIGALLFTGVTIAVLAWSAVWTDRTYRRFDELPGHYDFRGNATRLAPRRVMAWLLPAVSSTFLATFVILVAVVPPELQNGDPLVGIIIAAVTLMGAQLLVLRLLARWARGQDAGKN